jgi:hypothetical protein
MSIIAHDVAPYPTRRRPKGELRVLIKAGKLGWKFAGYSGNGHPRLHHVRTGARYVVARTPSDRRARKNAMTDLRRIADLSRCRR